MVSEQFMGQRFKHPALEFSGHQALLYQSQITYLYVSILWGKIWIFEVFVSTLFPPLFWSYYITLPSLTLSRSSTHPFKLNPVISISLNKNSRPHLLNSLPPLQISHSTKSRTQKEKKKRGGKNSNIYYLWKPTPTPEHSITNKNQEPLASETFSF